jgi:hypothetical protein
MERIRNLNLMMSFLFWAICIYIHRLLAQFVYNKGIEVGLLRSPPLYDILQNTFVSLQEYRIIPEVLHIIPVIILLFYTIKYKNKSCIEQFFIQHGSLMLLRGIFFSITLLPDSSQMCQVSNHFGGCFDLLFSGHSTIMTLCTLLILEHFYIDNRLAAFIHVNNIFTWIFIILCRNHYTIDVLISVILTFFVWKNIKDFNLEF